MQVGAEEEAEELAPVATEAPAAELFTEFAAVLVLLVSGGSDGMIALFTPRSPCSKCIFAEKGVYIMA